MYDIIHNIINHVWDNQYGTGDQSYIYYGCLTLIILLTVWLLDRISVFVISCAKGGKR